MAIVELERQHSHPLELIHSSRWMGSVLHQNGPVRPRVSSEEEEYGLRTVIATGAEQLRAADELVRRRYRARGYALDTAGRWGTDSNAARQRITLLAQLDDQLLGTLTVITDGPQGLLSQLTYGKEIRAMRSSGHRLGELVRFAVAEHADWKSALDALIQSAYLVTVVHGLTDVLIEVHPRHAPFYRRVFGFVQAGAERVCERVSAPSVLMRLDLRQIGGRLRLSAA